MPEMPSALPPFWERLWLDVLASPDEMLLDRKPLPRLAIEIIIDVIFAIMLKRLLMQN